MLLEAQKVSSIYWTTLYYTQLIFYSISLDRFLAARQLLSPFTVKTSCFHILLCTPLRIFFEASRLFNNTCKERKNELCLQCLTTEPNSRWKVMRKRSSSVTLKHIPMQHMHFCTYYQLLNIKLSRFQTRNSTQELAVGGPDWVARLNQMTPRGPFRLWHLYGSTSSCNFGILSWFFTYLTLQDNSQSSTTRCFSQTAHYKFLVVKARKAVVQTSYIEMSFSTSPASSNVTMQCPH